MRMALLTGEFRGTKVDTVAAVRGVNAIDPVWV
jgi:hypothetical protein